MTIAVNAVTQNTSAFFKACLLQLAQHTIHQFICITNSTTFATEAAGVKNITVVPISFTAGSPLRLKFWLRFKLPAIVKKYKVDILLHSNCCAIPGTVPQFFFIDDMAFLEQPGWYKKNWLTFYKKNMPAYLQKATGIIVTSEYIKTQITTHYTTAATIHVATTAADAAFKPFAHWQQKESAKEKYADGKEFFLFSGSVNSNSNLINLLKAFSFFKQRQKSNMQLVLATTATPAADFLKQLANYKYRNEVNVVSQCDEAIMATITAAAYAVVNPLLYDGLCMAPVQALQCHVPVIAANNSAHPAYCGDAATYCNAGDFTDIAAKMMLLFTNEDYRSILVARCREQAQQFSWHTTITSIEQAIATH
jgi:hypothetical protein